jgi:hypothetical protein
MSNEKSKTAAQLNTSYNSSAVVLNKITDVAILLIGSMSFGIGAVITTTYYAVHPTTNTAAYMVYTGAIWTITYLFSLLIMILALRVFAFLNLIEVSN